MLSAALTRKKILASAAGRSKPNFTIGIHVKCAVAVFMFTLINTIQAYYFPDAEKPVCICVLFLILRVNHPVSIPVCVRLGTEVLILSPS